MNVHMKTLMQSVHNKFNPISPKLIFTDNIHGRLKIAEVVGLVEKRLFFVNYVIFVTSQNYKYFQFLLLTNG